MKKRSLLKAVLVCVSASVFTTIAADKNKKLEEDLTRIPLLELPSHAAQIVKQTPAADRLHVAVLAYQTILQKHPAAADTVAAAIVKAAPEASTALAAAANKNDNEKGNGNNGKGNGNGNPNGNGNNAGGNGNGLGHASNKPGRVIVKDGPVNTTLPNGKPRHFPPEPPHRPVKNLKPAHYNRPNPR